MTHGSSSGRPIHTPSADYPITVAPTGRRVTVRIGGQVIADSAAALTLQESNHPAVQYIPLADVHQDVLSKSATTSYCPFKGDAAYYSVTTADGESVADAIWTYEQPFPAVAAIAGHVAFYPNKAEISIAED
ncbi:hypothetical protein BST33_17670 [Mycolicibacter minnesotensis]|uniref:Uncharacterized protein n=1 Tax=Mycolicibacter minnesotensis TaxID=1118379 RepID=A0A7I7R553_9MYCO|nr:DUF427 domain-containing protein [Mycolicibacter minnesotensis]ORA97988.1 hypothetical protein BST33_17670 [Mycolicibacter minnesotensis]BBY33779.1 hypothetical protein MMIN_18400 [Mycolicibacter minnesotensis]